MDFSEKKDEDNSLINGGFFVCEPDIFQYLDGGDELIFERTPLENLVHTKQLAAYQHTSFWKPMDTLREKVELQEFSQQSPPPWLLGI